MASSSANATRASSTNSSGSGSTRPTSAKSDPNNPHDPYNYKNIGWDDHLYWPHDDPVEKRPAQAAAASSSAAAASSSGAAASSSVAAGPSQAAAAAAANGPATVSPVQPGSNRNIRCWIGLYFCIRRLARNVNAARLWLDLLMSSEPLKGTLLPKASPRGPVGPPVQQPAAILPSRRSRLNPRSAAFVPAPAVPLPPPPPPSGLNAEAPEFHLPGSDILEPHVLSQFPPYTVRQQLHDGNHTQWSRMLIRVQRANPSAVGAIQQFAESEKQRYKGRM